MMFLGTCHDVLALRCALGEVRQNRPRWTGRILQRWILRGLQRAHRVVCISERTRSALLRVGGLSPRKLSVVANALHHPFVPMSGAEAAPHLERMACAAAGPFLLHVAGNIWYKNRDGVLRIFDALRALPGGEKYRLVMAGKPRTGAMHEFVDKTGLREWVTQVANAEDEDIRALSSSAEALLLPSLDEGFGWPIIEAQACGCPVIASDRPPMTEVGGDAAIYIDPANAVQSAKTILGHLPIGAARRQRGFDNVKRFDLGRMLEGHLRAYHTALGDPECHARPAPALDRIRA